MNFSLLVFVFSANFLLYAECSNICGIKFKNRIVGGSAASEHEWPWLVSIQLNYKHICGGTLINKEWVVSAAHCFLFSSSSAYKAIIGGHNITNSALGTDAIRRSFSKIIKHELFSNDQAFDIALLKLNKPVDFSMKILPACLPKPSDGFYGEKCYFAGWGLTYSNGEVQSTPRNIQLKVLDQKECSKYVYDKIEQKYCTGKMNTLQDTCQGDSGGGMMCQKTNNKWYLAGLVSYGIGRCGNVGVNAKVSYFNDWINSKISSN